MDPVAAEPGTFVAEMCEDLIPPTASELSVSRICLGDCCGCANIADLKRVRCGPDSCARGVAVCCARSGQRTFAVVSDGGGTLSKVEGPECAPEDVALQELAPRKSAVSVATRCDVCVASSRWGFVVFRWS
jgi:hypothetical protein